MTRRSAVIVSDNCKDELISALPLSTHSAVEMLHDSALYKFMIDIDIDIWFQPAAANEKVFFYA